MAHRPKYLFLIFIDALITSLVVFVVCLSFDAIQLWDWNPAHFPVESMRSTRAMCLATFIYALMEKYKKWKNTGIC